MKMDLRNQTFCLFLCAAGMAVPCQPAWSQFRPSDGVTLRQMQQSLAADGGRVTLERYFDCDTGKGYSVIEGGNRAAVEFAVEMLRYTDGCAGENMTFALARAMQKNPAAVLPYVNTAEVLHENNICVPLLPEGFTARQINADFEKSKKAVESVSDPKLQKQKKACLAAIARLR